MDLSFLLIYALNNFRAFFEGKNMSFLKSKTAIKAGELIGRDIMKKCLILQMSWKLGQAKIL